MLFYSNLIITREFKLIINLIISKSYLKTIYKNIITKIVKIVIFQKMTFLKKIKFNKI